MNHSFGGGVFFEKVGLDLDEEEYFDEIKESGRKPLGDDLWQLYSIYESLKGGDYKFVKNNDKNIRWLKNFIEMLEYDEDEYDEDEEDFEERKNPIKGGMGDKLNPEDVDKEQLEMGIKVEKEHTDDEEIAMDIALDHLSEDPEYYSKLARMEKNRIKVDEQKEIGYYDKYLDGYLYWASKNGKWEVYRTSTRVEGKYGISAVNNDSLINYNANVDKDGRVFWDFPERVPEYVKGIARLLAKEIISKGFPIQGI